MEIISYVPSSRKRSSTSLFKQTIGSLSVSRKNTSSRSYSNVSYNISYPTEGYVFKAGTVKKQASVRTSFATIGEGVSRVESFIRINIKKILLTVLIISAVAALGITGTKYYFFTVNHTGPLLMSTQDSLDIEKLDLLMASFALETEEVIEDPELLGMETAASMNVIGEPVTYQTYKVKSGDTISGVAKKFGLTMSTLIAVNDISNVRQLGAGQKLKIPSMDGILYTVKAGDSIASIVEKNKIKMETFLDVNELTSDTLTAGQSLFLPGVALDQKTLKNAMGELFILPINAKFRWSSPYGWRADPFTGVRTFHTGTDLACPEGTPILATMSGKVTDVGYNRIYGNYVIINHSGGYQTLYAHQSKIACKKGDWVSQGTRIGYVGNTGYSTGPHLHFMVYKNGKRIDPMTVLKK